MRARSKRGLAVVAARSQATGPEQVSSKSCHTHRRPVAIRLPGPASPCSACAGMLASAAHRPQPHRPQPHRPQPHHLRAGLSRLLVRPDGFVAWASADGVGNQPDPADPADWASLADPADLAGLEAALARWLGAPKLIPDAIRRG